MKTTNANKIRAKVLEAIMAYFVEADEDCGQIASNSFNFPIVADDGEEGWVEIVVKIPKIKEGEEDEGYAKRDEYQMKLQTKAEKKKAQAEAKAKKIARDKKIREEKKKEKGSA